MSVFIPALQNNIVFAASVQIRRNLARAEHDLERLTDCGRRDAKVGRTVAVGVQTHLRVGFVIIGPKTCQARVLRHRAEHNVAPPPNFFVAVAAEYQLKAAGERILTNAGRERRNDLRAGNIAKLTHNLGDHLRRGSIAVLPRRKMHDDVALIVGSAAARSAEGHHLHET